MRHRAHTFKENKGFYRQTADAVCFFIDVNQSKHSNHVILESYSKCISSKIIDDFAFKQNIELKEKQIEEKNPSDSKEIRLECNPIQQKGKMFTSKIIIVLLQNAFSLELSPTLSEH